ncbi:hypothetical protein CK203_005267 [Vitis vinifera]|uniref:Uncharacterized protein n=1 Tax=Vitis vinifera TaxID=29760 RepID=A0A438KEA5_VITVI|nr:hypothetical protein CK203_005267 [Vitis vinifera]
MCNFNAAWKAVTSEESCTCTLHHLYQRLLKSLEGYWLFIRNTAYGFMSKNIDKTASQQTQHQRGMLRRNKQLAYSQPVTAMLPPQNSGNSSLAGSKPSGIGLHLNSIVNAVPMGFSSTTSLKVEEKDYSSAWRISDSIPSNVIENSAGTEDRRNENKASIAMSSATSQSSHGLEPSKDPLLLKPIELHEIPCDKRKFNSEHMDSLEEFNQPSPKKRRQA